MGRIANRISTACRRWKRKEYFRVFHPSFTAERPCFIWRLGTAGRAVRPAFPSKEQLLWQTGLAEDALIQALVRLCQQKILQKVPDGAYTVFSRPLYLHYHSFRSFGQRLVRCAVLIFQ